MASQPAVPVILCLHGAGWVFGGARTHDRLVREPAVGVEAAVVFPEYALSPEARYPVAIEQNYAVAQWVVRQRAPKGMDGTRIAVAGDSAGGNMAIAWPRGAPGVPADGEGRAIRLRGRPGAAGRGR